MTRAPRHTKIVFTIGPATEDPAMIENLVREGVDVCRINMAHATHDWTRRIVRRVREVCAQAGREIAIMMDVKGPEIRTGDVGEVPLQLEAGEPFDFYMDPDAQPPAAGPRGVGVNYPKFFEDVAPGQSVLVDSGLIRLEIIEVTREKVRARVIIPGPLGNRRHINLPGVHVKLPALTRKDRGDIAVGVEAGIEFFALSFVRQPDDLDLVRRHLSDLGSKARLIAKIEDQQAISNLDDIIAASDGLMVARGDLGIECPFEELPVIQHRAIQTCIRQGRPVIVATHMLESMIENPVPTRAEVSDVATAVLERADCIMLSGETTTGKYPVECVQVFKRIAVRMEQRSAKSEPPVQPRLRTPKAKMMQAATQLAVDLEPAGVVVFTRSGYLAQMLSSLRSRAPLYAFTDNRLLFKQMLMLWGIEPFTLEFSDDPETTIQNAFAYLKRKEWAEPGDTMIVISNVLARETIIDTIQLRSVS
ncbi:MAG: pyruvate kinase [Opitutales bacterium]